VIFVPLRAGDPPKNLARLTAQREAENQQARSHYMYRQTVLLEEVDARNGLAGTYQEVRDVIFSPEGARTEQTVGKPRLELRRLKMTDEDFRDLREVQPFLFTPDQVFLYETRYRGEEATEGVDCWVLQVSPRQILQGQRLFEGCSGSPNPIIPLCAAKGARCRRSTAPAMKISSRASRPSGTRSTESTGFRFTHTPMTHFRSGTARFGSE
jgi:hypothetical protein